MWERTVWVDDDGSLTVGTAFSAARMNNLETGVEEAIKKALALPVKVASTSALPAYTRSGNKITANSNGILGLLGEFDGVESLGGEYVLLKDGAAKADNGVWLVMSGGSLSSKWSMERASEMSTSAQVIPGMEVWVERGTRNADRRYVLTTDGPITLNTTDLTFALHVSKDHGLVSALPTAAALVGDLCHYQADKTNGVIWDLIYDGEGTYPWKKIGGAPLQSTVAAQVSAASTAFAAPGTPVQVTLPLKGDYDIEIAADLFPAAGAERFGKISYSIGATAAADTWGAVRQASGASWGNTTTTYKYRHSSRAAAEVVKEAIRSGGAYNFFAERRSLWVDPIRVG